MCMPQYESDFSLLSNAHSQLEVFRPCFSERQLSKLLLTKNSNSILGHIDSSRYLSNVVKEIKSGVLTATVVAFTLSLISAVWAYSDSDNKEIIKS